MRERTFLEEQCGIICGRLGHSPKLVLPPQIRNNNTEVLLRCKTCGEEKWTRFLEGGYEELMKDIASGKIGKKSAS